MVDAHEDDAIPGAASGNHKPASPREVLLDELLHGDRELLIRHGEEVYHLRVTRNGRLLLTK
jgi:hemin uptake protein HemP